MSKNKKIIISIFILILLVVGASLIYFSKSENNNDSNEKSYVESSKSKVNNLYEKLKEKQEYSFKTTLDKENQTYYVKKNNVAYVDTTYLGQESKFIIKGGNSYLLMDDQNTYYVYQNNEKNLEKVDAQLQEILEKTYIQGNEKIDNKDYRYEEFQEVASFSTKNISDEELANAKTRFYFEGNKLVYIKTIVGETEELQKVEISYSIDDKLFEIPSDYKQM